jgi:NADPH-dependent curcumin reductase CurA
MCASSFIDVPSEADALSLSRRPGVEPEPADFELASVLVPAPRDGEVTVRTALTSVDPYMLPRMQGRSSYASPFPVGEPVAADSIGEVVASAHLGVPVGSWVVSHSGWRTYATVAGSPADVVDRRIGDPVAWTAQVVAVAGCASKLRHIRELGADEALDYTGPRSTRRSLARASAAWTCSSTTSAAGSSRVPCRSFFRMGALRSAAR